MADTTFVNGTTLTDADWFNDLNRLHYTIFGDPADDAAARANIGLAIGTDVQAYDADTAKLDVAQEFSAAQTFSAGALITGAALGGYGTGAGGTVTQATSKSTAVTLNKPCGSIVMHNASLAATTSVRFQLNNSLLNDGDLLIVNLNDSNTANAYNVHAENTRSGLTQIVLRNIAGGALAEPVKISFAIIKAVEA